jgi:uncharacterized protein (TIGR02217 family)
MATGFHEVRFPTDISYGSTGGPEFSTEVIALASAQEQRNINWQYPRERWDVAYGVRSAAMLEALRVFFYARCGRAYGFRFKNHDDFDVEDQELGEGDGAETEFQLVKTYTSGEATLTRKITKPVTGTVSIYADGVPQGSGWSVDTTTGIITFTAAPADGVVITADFEFDVPVRFDTDYLAVAYESYELRTAVAVPIVEIRI